MIYTSQAIEKAVEQFSSLPTIGKKTALRLAFHLLKQSDDYVKDFAQSLIELKEKVKFCSKCYNFTEIDPCPICSSESRNKKVICVVEQPADVFAIEKTNEYNGLYHVLHGVINPLEGSGAEDLKIKELIYRLAEVDEVILSLNPNVEGEVTTQFLAKTLKPLGIKVSRIARGVPMGSDIEYQDEATLSRALSSRMTVL